MTLAKGKRNKKWAFLKNNWGIWEPIALILGGSIHKEWTRRSIGFLNTKTRPTPTAIRLKRVNIVENNFLLLFHIQSQTPRLYKDQRLSGEYKDKNRDKETCHMIDSKAGENLLRRFLVQYYRKSSWLNDNSKDTTNTVTLKSFRYGWARRV